MTIRTLTAAILDNALAMVMVKPFHRQAALLPNNRNASALQAGDLFREEKDWLNAARMYRLHLKDRPDDVAIMIQLGHALKESGQLRAAMKAYEEALAKAPADADLHLQIGHLAKLLHDEPLMLSNYLRSYKLDPESRAPVDELAAYLSLGDAARPSVNNAPPDHTLADGPPAEPGIRSNSLSTFLKSDSAQAALRSLLISDKIREREPNAANKEVDAAYIASRLGLFHSSYENSVDVFSMMSTLRGVGADQPQDSRPSFGFGSVPARRVDPAQLLPQPNLLLEAYRRQQIEATARLAIRPEAAGKVAGDLLISILLPVYRGPILYVERAILSVLMQTYVNIEVCIVDDCSERREITALLEYYAAYDPRVRLKQHQTNQGIAAATNSALNMASGQYVALLDHDDMLAHDAIEVIVAALLKEPRADLVYSDECKIDGNDVADEMFNKPDWSPSLLLSVMYTGHLSVYRRATIDRVGGFRSEFDFSQDYDLALRVAEIKPVVVHVRECLYGWRMIAGSAALGGKPLARLSNVAALQDAATRRGLKGQALGLPLSNRIRHERPSDPPLVSLIIPSDNEGQIATAIASIVLTTTYPAFEIIVVTNSDCARSSGRQTKNLPVSYVAYDQAYNFSDKCNAGSARANGSYLIFFNDDVRVVDTDWIDVMLEMLETPGVGIVGPKLLYENGAIQHGGMVTGVRGLVGTAFHTFPEATPAYFGFAQCAREVSLICGACLGISAATYSKVGGFDAVNSPIAHSDVDLCFKVREAGLSCVYTPHTKLIHVGHLSIGETKKRAGAVVRKNKSDLFLLRHWGPQCANDPYFPQRMRDILYIDSQEPYELNVGRRGRLASGSDIILISHDLSNSGAPKVVLDLAQMLREQDHYVLVVSPVDGPFKQRLLDAGIDVMIDATCLSGDNPAFRNLARNFDLLIANTIVCWPAVNQMAQQMRCFWYIHETELVGHLKRAHPELGREAAHVDIWSGSRLAADALKEIGLDSVVIEYGVDRATSRMGPSRLGKVIISVLATIEPRKGQDLALLAFQKLPDRLRAKCELRFGGRVNDVGFLSGLEKLDQGRNTVKWLGNLTLEVYQRCLKETDVLLCPSRDDTLPLVTLDALAAGKILICSPATGTSAYIQDGISGFVAASSSVEDMASALTDALAQRGNWPRISTAAQAVFRKNFTKDKFHHAVQARLKQPPEKSQSPSHRLDVRRPVGLLE